MILGCSTEQRHAEDEPAKNLVWAPLGKHIPALIFNEVPLFAHRADWMYDLSTMEEAQSLQPY
jgi:hypothetical protein